MAGASVGSFLAGAVKITLPLAIKVSTFARPSASKCARSASTFTLRPPTLMARRKAICWVMGVQVGLMVDGKCRMTSVMSGLPSLRLYSRF